MDASSLLKLSKENISNRLTPYSVNTNYVANRKAFISCYKNNLLVLVGSLFPFFHNKAKLTLFSAKDKCLIYIVMSTFFHFQIHTTNPTLPLHTSG